MMFPKRDGRFQLLERMRQLLSGAETFTLAQAIDVFQESFANDRIDETSDGLMLVAWPIGRLGKRYFDIALSRTLGLDDEKWEEPPGGITAQLKIPCGLASMFLSQQLLHLEPAQREDAAQFFESIRSTRMYLIRWLLTSSHV